MLAPRLSSEPRIARPDAPLNSARIHAARRSAAMPKKTTAAKKTPPPQRPHDDLLTTTELVALAKKRLPEAAWDFIVGGAETETTIIRNRHALDSIAFRPRVLRNVEGASPATTFLGLTHRLPVLLAPIASLTDVDPEGALPVARAAAEFGCLHAREQRDAAVVRGGRARGRRAVRAAALHRRRREVGRRHREARRTGRRQGAVLDRRRADVRPPRAPHPSPRRDGGPAVRRAAHRRGSSRPRRLEARREAQEAPSSCR